jgi:hypothetical protein
MKPKKCKGCGSPFQPVRPLQVACSPMCGLKVGRAKLEKTKAQAKKAERKADVEKLAKLAPLRKLLKDAQTAFNGFIRERDRQAGHSCISSGRPLDWSGNQVDAGHYRSVGAASHLRFHENNVHAQSKHDNLWESGNAVEYRLRLIERIGLSRVEALEADNVPKKWRREEVIAIKEQYAAKLRELKKA